MLDRVSAYAPQVLSVLRIVTALLFVESGSQKLFAFPVPFPYPVEGLLLVAGILEFVGGLLLLIGLFTRPVAFVLCGFMAVAYWMGHAPMGLFPSANMGGGAILYCFIYLYIFFAGPGPWSVDEMLKNRRGGVVAA